MGTNGMIYGELLDLLRTKPSASPAGLFGTLTALSPLTLRVRGREISRGLFCPRGTVFGQEDLGREVALLPCEEGFVILFQIEEASI
ncbi:MAG: hypothetical protein E7429_00250 [Ruminococcaceae bacterium]|nr:hypothetical protein [Oscillospiraceae bacterium]